MTTQTQRVPALRFPGFEGEWEEKKLGDVVKINQGLQIPIANRFTEPVEDSYFYITNEFLRIGNTKKYYIKSPSKSVICDKESVLMTRTGNTGMVVTDVEGAFHNNFFKIAYPEYIDKRFLVTFLRRHPTQKQILRYAGTSTIPDLNHSDFYKLVLYFPAFSEQQKIASFLSSVDTKIEQLKKKKEKLEKYKKGMMQKLFSQEIRFKDDEGKNYPDWEEKRLGDVLDYEQPTKYLVKSADYMDEHETPVLTAGKTFVLGYTDEQDGIFKEYLPTIIFDDFTTAFKYVDFPFKAKSSAMKMLIIKKENMNIKYIYEAMQCIDFPLGEHKRHWISEYQEELINYPSLPEQQKIADFLSSIDDKIEKVGGELVKAQTFKKGLLQQMFV